MSDAWTFAGESADLGRGAGGSVTLVDQSTFCLSGASGDVHPGGAQGLFAVDTRLLSQLELRVGGAPPEALSSATERASTATFVGRATVGDDAAHLAVLRRRTVTGDGLDETLEVRSFAREAVDTDVTLAVAADLADLFAVKEGHVRHTSTHVDVARDALTVERTNRPDGRPSRYGVRKVRIEASGEPELGADGGHATVRWHLHLEAGTTWSARLSVRPADDPSENGRRAVPAAPPHATPPASPRRPPCTPTSRRSPAPTASRCRTSRPCACTATTPAACPSSPPARPGS